MLLRALFSTLQGVNSCLDHVTLSSRPTGESWLRIVTLPALEGIHEGLSLLRVREPELRSILGTILGILGAGSEHF